MKSVRFEDLAEMFSGQTLPCLEGTITRLNPPKNGQGQYGPWTIHSGDISDGTFTHAVCFTIDGGAQHLLNKQIKVECGMDGKNKPCDLTLEERSYNDKQGNPKSERQIKVGKRAKITVINGSGSSGPSGGSAPAPRAQSAPTGVSVQSRGVQAGDSTVEERVDAWFKILEVVCSRTGHDVDAAESGFSSTDLKEITTGISMSYKGQYGVYAPPVFGSTQSEPEATPPWQDFLYPAAGGKPERRLGDVPEPDQLRYVTWAIGLDKTKIKPEQQPVYDAVMAMADAKGWSLKDELEDEEPSDIPF